MNEIYNQAKTTFEEIRSKIDTSLGTLLVIGCSTSTVLGDMPGMNSNEEIAGDLYRAASETFSGDFEIAIEEGSTLVRVGTAIFGERDYSK